MQSNTKIKESKGKTSKVSEAKLGAMRHQSNNGKSEPCHIISLGEFVKGQTQECCFEKNAKNCFFDKFC